MAEPAVAPDGKAVIVSERMDANTLLRQHGGDAHAAIEALLGDVEHLRSELEFASLAMGYGFARGWRPSFDRRTSS